MALPADVTSLSGVTITPAGLVLRLLATVAYIVVSMLGVAAIALFLSTVTDSALGAALGALAVLVASQVLVTLDAAAGDPAVPADPVLAGLDRLLPRPDPVARHRARRRHPAGATWSCCSAPPGRTS